MLTELKDGDKITSIDIVNQINDRAETQVTLEEAHRIIEDELYEFFGEQQITPIVNRKTGDVMYYTMTRKYIIMLVLKLDKNIVLELFDKQIKELDYSNITQFV